MDNKIEILNKDAIVSIKEFDRIIMPHITFKVSEFIEALRAKFGTTEEKGRKWVYQGAECEILSPGKDWRKGKVRISLEFLPDELVVDEISANKELEITQPESPLDDLRQMMNHETQQ